MSSPANILEWARKVQAIAQNGLAFTQDPFDRERFEQLQELVTQILTAELEITPGQIAGLWQGEEGYATPKVDVRGGVFKQDKVLLVRERSDGKWTLPGGWVDVDDGPSFAVEREIREESGYLAKRSSWPPWSTRNNPSTAIHPASCTSTSCCSCASSRAARRRSAMKPTASSSFRCTICHPCHRDAPRKSQIERLYEHHLNRGLPTDFD